MRRSKKSTLEDFVKDSCYFYDNGNCSILTGVEVEKGSPVQRKCLPSSMCEIGKDIKNFMKKIKVDEPVEPGGTVPLSRYLE